MNGRRQWRALLSLARRRAGALVPFAPFVTFANCRGSFICTLATAASMAFLCTSCAPCGKVGIRYALGNPDSSGRRIITITAFDKNGNVIAVGHDIVAPYTSPEEAIERFCGYNDFGTPFLNGATPPPAVSDAADAAFPDLNLDSILDVVVADRGADTVVVYLANADGTFANPVPYTAGPFPEHIVTADFNGDSIPDVVTANANSHPGPGSLSLLLGNADGTLQAALTIPAPGSSTVTDVAVGDFDGNGDSDLTYTTLVSGFPSLQVRLGNGDGSFQGELTFSLPTGGSTVRVADLNETDDTHDDILTNGAFLLGNGNGTFQPAAEFAQTFLATIADAGDLNGDGHADLAAADSDHLFSVRIGNGDGTFQTPFHLLCGGMPEVIQFTDLDGDGTQDLFVSHFPGVDPPDIYHGDGQQVRDGTRAFPAVANLQSRSGGDGVAVAEFTGDGIPDLVVGNGSAGLPVLLPGLGGGSFGAPQAIPGGSGWATASGDWNSDGKNDVAFAGGVLLTALGNGDGTFGTFHSLPLPGGSSTEWKNNLVISAFLDAGATPDLVVANTASGEISPFFGNGDGTFTAGSAVAAGTEPSGIAAGDFNKDGKADLAATFQGDFGSLNGKIGMALGNGDGTFQTFNVLKNNVAPASVAVADIDGDDNLDLAVALEVSTFNWDVEIYRGNGSGAFSPPEALGLNDQLIRSVEVLDADQDGIPDLAVAFGGTRVLGLRGLGGGMFVEAIRAPIGFGDPVAADIDGDGWPDLISASRSGYVAVRHNILTPISAAPFLEIMRRGPDIIVRWPIVFPEFSLLESTTMAPPWDLSAQPVTASGNWFESGVDTAAPKRFFVLGK